MSPDPLTRLTQATDELCASLASLSFAEPVTHVYNPLIYARKPHQTYLNRFASGSKRVLFLGMNPGPWGMAQTGVPFGEVAAVRDWMGICESVSHPEPEHPKRPVEGFACPKSEVSGRRLWGLFAQQYPAAEAFFAEHLVVNYCPLVFMEKSGRNRTPDKLPSEEIAQLQLLCDRYLREYLEALQPQWLIGVGAYAEKALQRATQSLGNHFQTGRILHPSPASPAANRGWDKIAKSQLLELGVW